MGISRRRFIASSGAAVASISGIPALLNVASAQTAPDYYIKSNGVRLRSNPGTSQSVLATMNSGDAVDPQGGTPEYASNYIWVKVRHEKTGTTGWVANDFVGENGVPDLLNGKDLMILNLPVVIDSDGGAVNVRESEGLSGKVLFQVADGTKGVIRDQGETMDQNEWYLVLFADGRSGYVGRSNLAKADGTTTPTPGTGTWPNGSAVYVSDGPLNLRATAGGTIKKTYPTGTNAKVTGSTVTVSGVVWVPVTITADGTFGYFSSQFLTKGTSGGGTPSTQWPDGALITVTDGPLNLRKTANGTIIRTYPTGTPATVTGNSIIVSGTTWVPVTIAKDGAFGYFSSAFISRETDGGSGTGDQIRISDGPLNVRSTPNGTIIKVLQTGSYGQRTSDPAQIAGGTGWIKVVFYDAAKTTGWVAEDFVTYVR